MKVTVKAYLYLRDVLNFTSLDLDLPEGSTVESLLSLLRSAYQLPDQVELPQGRLVLFEAGQPVGLTILLDGRNVKRLQGLETELSAGMTVTLFPPAAGG